ncbi:DUF4838 domain-containing protein [Propionibacteriaceae bacterium Y2011]
MSNQPPHLHRRTLLTTGSALGLAAWLGVGPTATPRALAVDDLVLVRQGVAEASIVLAADPTTEEEQAAAEIVEHVRLITGATIPLDDSGAVLIHLGPCPAPVPDISDQPEAFVLSVETDRIQIQGNIGQGVLAGAIHLLTMLGVRWLDPRWTHTPSTTTLAVTRGVVRDQPWWAYRTPTALWHYAPPFPRGPEQQLEPTPYARRHRLTASGNGVGGHGLPLVPKPNPTTEPELFIRRKDGTVSPQADVTHPEILVRALRGAREMLAKNPAQKWLSIGPDDGLGFESTDWDAGDWDPLVGDISVTDRYVKFFNLMLAELQADDPEVGIVFFAYVNYMRPPVREVPNSRLVPMFAPITVDRIHNINDPDGYERRYVFRLMEQWRALGVQVASYSYLDNLADPGLPFSPLPQVAAEMPAVAALGSKDAVRVEPLPSWGYDSPGINAAMAVMWDPQVDLEALTDEFFALAYGPGATAMRQHFASLDEVYRTTSWTAGSMYDSLHVLTPEVMTRLEPSLQAAERAVEGSGTERHVAQVSMVRLRFDYGQQLLAMMRYWRAGEFAEAKVAYDAAWQLGQRGATNVPVAVYPLRAQYQSWFWNKQVHQALDKTSGDNELVATARDRWDAIIDNGVDGLADAVPTSADGLTWRTASTNERTWSGQGLRYLFGGGLWYRTTVEVPERFRGRALRLWIGAVDDRAQCWINGHPAEATGRSGGLAPWEFDARGLIRFGEENEIVVKASNITLDEIGTGGIQGPVFVWAGEADATPVKAPAAPTLPHRFRDEWQRLAREAARLDAMAPRGPNATRLPHAWQAIVDPSGKAVEVGLWEPQVDDNHWMPLRSDKTWADQGIAYYTGGMVQRTRLPRVKGRPSTLWIARASGTAQAWLDGEPLTPISGADGGSWEFALPAVAEGQVLVLATYAPNAVPGTGGVVGPVVLY